MDTFAGYESDSSGSKSLDRGSSPNQQTLKTKDEKLNKKKGSLLGLLAAYSEDEDENESVESRHNESPQDGKNVELSPYDKKRKLNIRDYNSDDNIANTEEEYAHILAQPRLLSKAMEPFDAMIHFTKNYTCNLPGVLRDQYTKNNTQQTNQKSLQKKLKEMHSHFYADKNQPVMPRNETPMKEIRNRESFASNLRSKKEFGNPYMFPSVVAHYGISQYGSNIPHGEGCSDSNGKHSWKKFEYVDRIVAGESQSAMKADLVSNGS